MEKYALIIGDDELGISLAKAISSMDHRVVLLNIGPEKGYEFDFEYICGSLKDEKLIDSLDIDHTTICICALKDDFFSSLECVRILKSHGAGYIVAEAEDEVLKYYLKLGGVKKIIRPFSDYALVTAAKLLGKDELELTYLSDVQALFQRKIPDSWAGKTLSELDIRRKYDANVLGVRRNGEFLAATASDFALENGDELYALGDLRKVFDMEES